MTRRDRYTDFIHRRLAQESAMSGKSMGALTVIVALAAVASGCRRDAPPHGPVAGSPVAPSPATRTAPPATTPSAGMVDRGLVADYRTGDGLGYNIQLSLRADGTFSAMWYGCVGVYGRASGNWARSGDRVTFRNHVSERRMTGYLAGATVVAGDKDPALVLDQSQKFYRAHGLSRLTALLRTAPDEP